MSKTLPKINTNSLDELFTIEEQRQKAKLEKVMKIPIDEIKDFKKNPFNVRMDSEMEFLIESVSENDILVPVLIRPNKKKTVMKWFQDIVVSLQCNRQVQLKLMPLFVT